MKSQSEELLGTRIKMIRNYTGMNQTSFAKGLGISTATLSDIENNKHKPGFDILIKFMQKYKVELYYLMLGEGPMFSEGYGGVKLDDEIAKDQNVRKFLHYFASSSFVRFHMLAYFEKLYNTEQVYIEKAMKVEKRVD